MTDFVATDDPSHPVRLAPPPCHVGPKSDADALSREKKIRELEGGRGESFSCMERERALVCLVLDQEGPEDLSKAARLEKREHICVCQFKRCNKSTRRTDGRGRTHQTFRPWLVPYAVNFTDVVQSDAVLAEQPAVHHKVALLAVRRQDGGVRRRWRRRLGRAYEGRKGH